MKYEFKVKMYFDYWNGDKREESYKSFTAHNYDDLQNLILTLVDFSEFAIKFEVIKKEVKDDE